MTATRELRHHLEHLGICMLLKEQRASEGVKTGIAWLSHLAVLVGHHRVVYAGPLVALWSA